MICIYITIYHSKYKLDKTAQTQYNFSLLRKNTMIDQHLLNLVTKNTYTHVMSMNCSPAQSVEYTAKLVKVLKNYTNKVVIFSCPAEPSKFTGYVGMHVQVLALPQVHKEVFSLVGCLSI